MMLKGPSLVLVIEWQLRWTNKCLCWDTQEISPHKDTSMSNMCHGGEMSIDGPVAMEKGKLRLWSEGPRDGEAWQDLVPMDRGNGEERARSRSMDQRGHVMIWSGSYHLRKIKPSVDSWWWSKGLMEFGACVASIFGKMKWNAQGKGMTCRAFHFTGQRLCRDCLLYTSDAADD